MLNVTKGLTYKHVGHNYPFQENLINLSCFVKMGLEERPNAAKYE